jgi:hypothetical protein
MGEKKGAYRVYIGKPGGEKPLGRFRQTGRIILKCILEK